MVATVAPAGMPSRQFSTVILGGSWPFTEPESFQSAAEAQHAKGVDLLRNAEGLRQEAERVTSAQSGQAIEGYCRWCYQTAAECTAQADHEFFPMSHVSDGVARLLYGLREDLDRIDRQAHEEIERIQQQSFGPAMGAACMAVVAAARAEATEKAVETATAIAERGAQIGIEVPNTWLNLGAGAGGSGTQESGIQLLGNGSGNAHGMTTGAGFEKAPLTPGHKIPEAPPQPRGTRDGMSVPAEQAAGADSPPGNVLADPTPGDKLLGNPTPGGAPPLGQVGKTGGSAPSPMSGGVPSLGMPGSAGGMSGGGLPGGMSGGGLPGGLGSGLSGQGLGSSGSLGGAGMPSGAGSMPGSDFSRGLSGGLANTGGTAPFVPPMTSAPASAPPTNAVPPAGATTPGVTPGGPPTPLVSPSGSSGVPVSAPATGAAGMPAAPMGALPPFGSDVPRSAPVASAAAAAVSPAAGAAAAPAAPAGGGASGGPVASLPPGVVGSGVGASSGAASEGVRASLPDPLLESASQLVYQLLHDSRMYPYMDWCVGVFRSASGVQTVIANSDGAGYIPVGVFVPRSARMLFTDPGLGAEFRSRWFGWANPAETMLAYAELVIANDPSSELWALAVSTDHGGSSVPARSMVPHVEDCGRALSPIGETAPVSALDEAHMHRLETLDRGLYARLSGFGEGRLPDRSEAWRMTAAAAQTALGRIGAVRDVAVAPVIRAIMDSLAQGLPVPEDSWQELQAAHIDALMYAVSLRPGRVAGDTAASVSALAYHDLSRLTELLGLWQHDGIKYPEIAYLTTQIQLSPQPSVAS